VKKEEFCKPFVYGESLRDWFYHSTAVAFAPYDENFDPIDYDSNSSWGRYLWPYRINLETVVSFAGKNRKEIGQNWWEWYRWIKNRFSQPMGISFAEVASHNHFVLFDGGVVYKQTAPVVKLKGDASLEDYHRMTGLLNSSIVCFYMKQVSHQKQMTGGDGVRVESVAKVPYQYSGTALGTIPLPSKLDEKDVADRLLALSLKAISFSSELKEFNPRKSIDKSIKEGVSVKGTWESFNREKQNILGKLKLIQEEIDWTAYVAFGLCSSELLVDISSWGDFHIEAGQRPFEIFSQENQEGFEVPLDVPSYWANEIQIKWRQRIKAIESIREIRVVENSHYKRRWVGRQGLFNKSAKTNELQAACKEWMLEYLEKNYCENNKTLTTCGQLADKLRNDDNFNKVAAYYTDNDLYDLQKLIGELAAPEHIPQFSAGRYKPKAMPKLRAWQEVWDKQRQEDTIDAEYGVNQPLLKEDAANEEKLAVFEIAKAKSTAKKLKIVGDIPIPPKYAAGDFRKPSYWKLRGKLDVPKERFFSLPGCEKDGDSTLVIGWAGMNHLQRATAIATWYLDRKETDGWEAEKLKPMLVALDELIPWLKQWHNDIDPEFGERMGDYYEGFLSEEMRMLDVTKDDLLAWEPPAVPKKKAAKKKTAAKKSTAKKTKPKSESLEANDTDTSKEQG